MNLPFYVAENQILFGKSYECRYFNTREEAELDCAGIPGAYVVETSPGTGAHIFRATVPE